MNLSKNLFGFSNELHSMHFVGYTFKSQMVKWRPPSLSELTSIVFNTGLIDLGSEASKYNKEY